MNSDIAPLQFAKSQNYTSDRLYGLGYSKNRGLKWLNGLSQRGPEAKGGGVDEIFKLGFQGRVIGFGSILTEA